MSLQASKDACDKPGVWPAPVIPRGDLQTTFVFKGFDEVRRLGLQQETERRVRNSKTAPGPEGAQHSTGMLVVDSVVPGCACDGVIEAGDVLVELNGQVGAYVCAYVCARVCVYMYVCVCVCVLRKLKGEGRHRACRMQQGIRAPRLVLPGVPSIGRAR